MKTSLVLALTLISSVPASAFACSCLEPGATWFSAPEDGSVGVPTNTLVWVGGGMTRGLYEGEAQHSIELVDADGVVVPGSEARMRATSDIVDVFTPDFILDANSTYSVRVNGEVQSTFTTGDVDDTEPPAVPTETERSSWSEPPSIPSWGMCGSGGASHGLGFGFDTEDSVLILLDNDARSTIDGDNFEGTAPAITVHGYASIGNGFSCGGDNWEGAALGARTDVRYAAFDLAGNFSGWSAEESVSVSPRGCNAAGNSSPIGLVAFLGFAGLTVVRRRT